MRQWNLGREEAAPMTSLDAAAETQTGVTVGDVDVAVARANLDKLAKRFLSISGAEFLKRRKNRELGEVERLPGFTRVLAVATLLD